MKTMLELLIRLQEVRCCRDRALANPQLTCGEKTAISALKRVVRECIPAKVLSHYDRMNKSERMLQNSPEVFAMAVLVSTYRSLTPSGRRKLVSHFSVPTPLLVTDSRTRDHGGAPRRRPKPVSLAAKITRSR